MTNPATTAQVTAVVEHPAWCDLTRCTVTPRVARGEAHRGTPLTVTVRGIYGTLRINAVLSQSHRRWPADVYVGFDVKGLRREHQAAGGLAALTVANLAAIGQLVMDLAKVSGSGSAGSASRLREQQGRARQPSQVTALVAGGGGR